MDSSEMMVIRMGRLSLASDMETDQYDGSSAMSLEVILMSYVVDWPFVGSNVASFSLRMV